MSASEPSDGEPQTSKSWHLFMGLGIALGAQMLRLSLAQGQDV